ncbi:beta-ketoacyl-ACP synthase III [Streptomyces olivaceoviridis]|uniref:beta-ketoacyl-ACP synthase III n=1 Tax=Streptomyces olivaceoviridis TaxID=1921 RepID=UPI00167A5A22|nr:beta-ketoacyl-ACP synthase III [Streptomyces olivaceoviridis]GGZ01606.1 3-oxoacyl-[acyl-carrier-protein] synthase 3 [Streptomyces olivaceoviridis]
MTGHGLRGGTTAVLAGLGTCVPPKVVTNDDLSLVLDTSDEWIVRRTGIRRRHVIEPGSSTSVLAAEAGRRALKSAQCDEADAVVLATSTPDMPCPATAPEVADALGLAGVPAFDVGAVCAGFVYALATGAGLISTGIAERVLVIGADTFSTILDPTDRTTRAIFGDGAGAVLLRQGEPGEPGALGPFDLGSDGSLSQLITVPAGGSRQRASGVPAAERDHYFTMQGKPVFKQAVTRMTESSRSVLARAGWTADDVDRVVAHQANARILAALADSLGLPPHKIASNIDRVGNTVAASIPLALADADLRTGEKVLLTAFGGGLSWGSTVLHWPDVVPQ